MFTNKQKLLSKYYLNFECSWCIGTFFKNRMLQYLYEFKQGVLNSNLDPISSQQYFAN